MMPTNLITIITNHTCSAMLVLLKLFGSGFFIIITWMGLVHVVKENQLIFTYGFKTW